MMPHCKRESQFELFETTPHDAHRPPKLALPFQRSQEVDINRIAKILGIDHMTATRMVAAGLFRSFKIPGEKRPRIEYDSVVEYCNRLRLEYRISDRMLAKLRGRRHRDEDLLPFPLKDTVSVAEVRKELQCPHQSVRCLIEEGVLVAYQVYIGMRGSPWRIQKQSLERYVESLHLEAARSRNLSPSRL